MGKKTTEQMDTAYIKERNYRMVENVRRENQRAQRRLDEVMYSKQGVEATKNYQIEAVAKEQKLIRKELAKIRQTTTTTWGVLPPRDRENNTSGERDGEALSETHNVDAKSKPIHPYKGSKREKKRQRLTKMMEEEDKKKLEHLKQFNDIFPSSSPTNTLLTATNHIDSEVKLSVADERSFKVKSSTSTTTSLKPAREVSIADMNVTEAKDLVNKRLLTQASESTADKRQRADSPGSPRPPRALAPIHEKNVLPIAAESVAPSDHDPPEWNDDIDESIIYNDANVDTDNPGNSSNISKGTTAKNKGTTSKKKDTKKKTSDTDGKASEMVFDAGKYNSDGSLRMMHTLPDFNESITQALRARYVRNNFKQWFERELTVGQIFSEDEKYDSGNVKLYTVKASNLR